MCTISVVRNGTGFRMVCNRDERLSRPAAEPPAIRPAGSVVSAWPVDPLSGGTWIGVNEVGFAACILNRTPRHPAVLATAPRSRGTILPSLLAEMSMATALRAAAAIPAALFKPFTLVLLHRGLVAVLTNRQGRMTLRLSALLEPRLFTSSSLGDHVVRRPRRSLFARMVAASSDPLQAQAAFHDHQWVAHPQVSVRMRRPEAATVSQTVVDVAKHAVHVRYRALHS